jgi:glutamine synthetase
MTDDGLVFVGVTDLAGKLRGKGFPLADLEHRLGSGVGWVPTNAMITCFDTIGDGPYGSLGDLLIIPDPRSKAVVELGGGAPVIRLLLGDIVTLDGRPWECCTRSILKQALARLERVAGLRVTAAFEQEFHIKSLDRPPGDAFTFEGFYHCAAFGETLMSALRQAGMVPDQFLREYGADQYEVTIKPADGLVAADQAAIMRVLTRSVAAQHGLATSFTPLRQPGAVGNGVHIHISFTDPSGAPATYDPAHPHGLSAATGTFISGVVKYLEATLALMAPSVVSYGRLQPHRWSAAFNNVGFRDREASVRICPVDERDPDSARKYNIEIRAADATASPHLALAAIIHAGAQGFADGLGMPEVTREDLSLLDGPAIAARGLVRLPATLEAALACFSRNHTVMGWFAEPFQDVYLAHKAAEMQYVRDMSETEICSLYEVVY